MSNTTTAVIDHHSFLADQNQEGKIVNVEMSCNHEGICDLIRNGIEMGALKSSDPPIPNNFQLRHASVYPEYGHELPLVILYDKQFLAFHDGNNKDAEHT